MTRRRITRTRLAVVGAVGLLVATLSAGSVLAVHDLDLELDGDTDRDAISAPPTDWEDFFDAAGAEKALPANFTDSGFDKDFTRNTNGSYNNADGSTFATGSKDTLSISPGWQCNRDNNVSDKVDLTNAYAAVYKAPATIPGVVDEGDSILYFALERFANDGDANVGFWFLQDDVVCESEGGSEPFVGGHQDGDILVVSAFTKGGDVSVITAYRWVGDDDTGGIDPTPIATGGDCRDPLTPANDTACAVVNTDTIDPPWDNENKRGGANVRVSEFFEGGLNLTASGILDECFSTFLADTRSSQSLTATLFDFAGGELGECGVEVTTSPSVTTIQLGAGTVTDTATVTGTGGTGTPPPPTGTVAFFVCQPSQLDSNGECSTGGTQVGTPAAGETLAPSGASSSTATSEAYTPTVIGKHCWRAVYSGDETYDPSTDFDGQTECFTVTGVATLVTDQRWLPNDSATISGPTTLSGTATFTLYTGTDCGAGGDDTVVYGPQQVAVSGASPQTVSTSNLNTYVVVEATEGGYSWKVSYTDAVLGAPSDRCETTTIDLTD